MRAIAEFLKKIDWFLAVPVMVLLCFSLAELYSISLGQSASLELFQKQLAFVAIGLVIFFVLALIDFHHFYSYSNYLYIGAGLMLIAVLLFGQTINATRGWFGVFGFGLQPVEFAKLVLIVFLARYFSKVSVAARPFKHLVISGLLTLPFVGLVLLQPDLGSAALLFAIWLVFLIAVGFPKKYFLAIGGALVILLIIAWQFVFQDYQRERLLTYLSPASSSTNYNVQQAIIAVGAGGMFGRGLGFGSQSQLKFLPEANTDFMFAVIAEELGFIGVLLILACFSFLLWRFLTSLPQSRNYFGSLLVIGGLGLIFTEMFINIGMNMGMLPVVGIPLPFVSYGGSSLLAHLALVGIMHSVIRRSAAKR